MKDAVERMDKIHEIKKKIRVSKGNDYANEDCLANFKVRAAVYSALKKYNMEPDLTTPQGVATWDIILKLLRILNLDQKKVKAENEAIGDSHIDLENYSELAAECRIDHYAERLEEVS